MNVLFTSGGTEEPIDGVRKISNTSTGRTGLVLASCFAQRGASVSLLISERVCSAGDSISRKLSIPRTSFSNYANLRDLLQKTLSEQHWDAVVHLAAVSDYIIDKVTVDGKSFSPGGPGKIGTAESVVLHLKPTAKILDSLRGWSCNPKIIVVGFKLTAGVEGVKTNEAESQVKALFLRNMVDFVVHNELHDIRQERHPASIWNRSGLLKSTETKIEMAEALFALLSGELQ